MVTFEEAILWIDLATLLFVFISLIFLKKCRDYERFELESSLNAMLFGVFFLFVAMLSNTMIYLGKVHSVPLETILPQANLYISYLGNITELGLFPLFGVCFLVAILIAKAPLARKEGA